MFNFQNKATYLNQNHQGSEKYSMVQTGALIEMIRGEGYEVSDYSEAATRKFERRGLQKHVVRMCKPGLTVDDSRPELVIINSYDKTKALNVNLGFFRFVCSNGLIVGDSISSFKSKHLGFDYDGLMNFVSNFKAIAEQGAASMDRMKTTKLNSDEQEYLATYAWLARQEMTQDKILELPQEKRTDFIKTINQSAPLLLKSRRMADNNNDAWSVFNRVQENLIRGRKGRFQAIRSVGKQVQVNQKLWGAVEDLVA